MQLGLIQLEGGFLRLTERGMELQNAVVVELMDDRALSRVVFPENVGDVVKDGAIGHGHVVEVRDQRVVQRILKENVGRDAQNVGQIDDESPGCNA